MAKILLVEDDQFLSSLLKNRLQKENYEVVLATDGEAAINYLRTADFDLILLDIILPKKTGFEVLEEINLDPRFQAKKPPIIIISNLGQVEDIKRGQELGVIEYLIKAKISIDDLINKVKEFLKNK
ncbi:response regulator [Candidatus Wolfebacteria bacterium]|nr:response regulator [Candidatus Wolfebacteria bacterium]